jgi:hypothetical protein
VFVAVAEDIASFDCETAPPFPQLSIRIGPLSFVAPTCVAEDKPIASWPISLDWPIACTAGPPWQPQPEGDWYWVPVCVTGAVFVAVADDAALFDWVSEPSLPPEAMRTGSLVFEAPNWSADEAAKPSWPISLDWPIA